MNDYILTGHPVFDLEDSPGLPQGRAIHLYGAETTGKTLLALLASAAVCRAGGVVLYIDWMNSLSPDWLTYLGVPLDPDQFMLVQPGTQEDGLNIAAKCIAAGVDLVVFDAIGVSGMDVLSLQDLRKLWANNLSLLTAMAHRSGTCLLGIDYEHRDLPRGVTLGGMPWQFAATRRIRLERQEHPTIEYEITKGVGRGTRGTFTLPVGAS